VSLIYHLALAGEWEADRERPYDTSTLGRLFDEVGFIHCSYDHQVQRIADLVYRGRDDVLLLEIDPARVDAPIEVEDLDDSGERFPHIYGPLNRDAVVRIAALALARRRDGTLDCSAPAWRHAGSTN